MNLKNNALGICGFILIVGHGKAGSVMYLTPENLDLRSQISYVAYVIGSK